MTNSTNLADNAGSIERDAREIQDALAKQGIGEDRITLDQIGLALRGLYTLWDAALDAYRAVNGHGENSDEFLFRKIKHKREGMPMHRSTFDQVFRKYAALAELPPDITPYAARATFITEALEKEHPPEAVQRTVGHAHISTTLAYDKRDHHPRKSASFVRRVLAAH